MIIDTNVYSALDNGLQSAVDILRGQKSILLPIFVVAELRYGFANGLNKTENETRLDRFLSQNGVEVSLPTLKTAEHYASLAMYCKQAGRALSQNDLWIAAIAQENGMRLVTYDKDFKVFQDIFGGKLVILES